MNSVAITAEREPAEAAPRPAKEERSARKDSARGADTRPQIDKLAPGQTAARAKEKPDHSFFNVVVLTTVAVLAAFAVGRSGKYTAGDDVGYYIGLVGGVLMLLLLLYPLRKHVAALRNWGKVKYWFAVHMVLGISGPVLVLAHSTFHMRSTNAAVALICMLVVAGSGIIGRGRFARQSRRGTVHGQMRHACVRSGCR